MSCCDPNTVAWDGITMRRRTVLKGAAALAGILGANPARAAGKPIKLAFCSPASLYHPLRRRDA